MIRRQTAKSLCAETTVSAPAPSASQRVARGTLSARNPSNLLQTICTSRTQTRSAGRTRDGGAKHRLFHQEHLPGALDSAVQAPLVMGRQAGVFARKDAAGFGDKLLEQIDVFVIERIGSEINLGLGSRGADFHDASSPRAATRFVNVGLARHEPYLISRCNVWRRRNGLYFLSSIFSVFNFLLRVVR